MKYISKNKFFKHTRKLEPTSLLEKHPHIAEQGRKIAQLEAEISKLKEDIENTIIPFMSDDRPIVTLTEEAIKWYQSTERYKERFTHVNVDNEWLVNHVSIGRSGLPVLTLRRLNKKIPWELIGESRSRRQRANYHEINVDLTRVLFVGETLQQRIDRIDKEKVDFSKKLDKLSYSSIINAKECLGLSASYDLLNLPREKWDEFLNLCKLT